MLRRLLTVPSATAVVAGSMAGGAPAPASASARDAFSLAAPSRFSPNGDGVKDTLRVKVTVPRRTHVRLTIGSVGGRLEHRRVDLGRLPSGTHTWTWDGRNQSGKVVADQAYVIRAYDVAAGRDAAPLASDEVQVDTGFSPLLSTPTFGACAYTTANGCGDDAPCGEVVPSTTYAGGLSYRPRACEPADPRRSDAASARHMLEVPEATGVRGLDAVRVSFVGAPTTAGEADTGTLVVAGERGASTVVGTSGRSEWVEDPAWGEGLDLSYPIPQRDPAALWSFSTSGTSSVDVATFTVDVRYLAVAD